MALSELYSKYHIGVKIWIPDQRSVWIGATILHFNKETNVIKIINDNGETLDLKLNKKTAKSDTGLPFLRNPDILIGQKDLTSLSYLNEPEVLYNLQIRFCERREIYTYCGIVLVAINPYQELAIYGNEIINAYHLQNSNNLDPHIFAVAENAFRRMANFDENQSVIVSGESGAGKTVSAKYTMRYFALVGGSKNKKFCHSLNETQIERKVLLSNPILEAFGNAKTIRNDNSSRFGKYLEIMFNRKNQITGANMCTYLLEKSRVVYQNLGERNYHIFYQIVNHCRSGDELLTDTGLINNADNYNYLKCGEALEIDGVDDAEEFIITKNSFMQLGIDVVQLKKICEVLAAILHLGNIRFKSGTEMDSSNIENEELLSLICSLLGCSVEQMKIWLCFRTISTFQETLHKPLSQSEAQYFRDALVKTIYSNLFDWIVKKANKSLSGDMNVKIAKSFTKVIDSSSVKKFIGVLDIYGFETFDENSFEQFCINFANEKLQLQFNMHVFKLEQEEYMKEGLEWTFIDYYNNQPCIDLIESKLGLLDLLDEECKMFKGSDENWCVKIYSHHLTKSRHFSKPKLSNTAFIIEHFAGLVQYECMGFIEKNRDSVLEEQINLLKASDVSLVAELFSDYDFEVLSVTNSKIKVTSSPKNIQITKQDNARKMKKTVGSQFRNSLKSLMETLNKTNPHYVRCIKPNDLKLPFTFCPERAVQQLRACGVLETIRLSAAGFPSRWTYNEFYQRYYILLPRCDLQKVDKKIGSQKIVESLIKQTDAFRFGQKKLFFRSGQVAYLEKLRSEKIENSVTLIQSMLRGSMARKRYLNTLQLVINLQSFIRRKNALVKAYDIRRNRAAIRIQSFYRMYRANSRFLKIKKAVINIKYWWSKIKMEKLKREYKKETCVILCQSVVRAFIQRNRYLKIRRGVIQIQNHYRRRKAKAELQILKIEARSLHHIKFVNRGLENKIIELTQRLNDKEKETSALQKTFIKEKKLELELQKQNQLEAAKIYQSTIQELQGEIIKLKKELTKEVADKKKLILDNELSEVTYKKKISDLETAIETLKSEVNILEPTIAEIQRQERVSSPSTNQKYINEQLDHQKLVHDYAQLEMKYENLYKEYTFIKSSMFKSSVDSVDNIETKSNISESDSFSSKEDADVDSFSEGDEKKSKKQTSTVIAKVIPNFNQTEVCTAGDLAVVMQLQMRINSISKENHHLKEMIQELEDQLLRLKYSMENERDASSSCNGYDNELRVLFKEIKSLDDDGFKSKLIDKIADLKRQLSDQSEECQKLRRNMFSGTLGKLADAFDSSCSVAHCEEQELHMAFESQKEANRKMLKEIEEIKTQDSNFKKTIVQLRHEKEQLQIQIGKQKSIIKRGIEYINNMQNLKLTPKERLDKFVQNEISRILVENLKLQKRNDQIMSETIQLKRGLKYFALRLQKYEGALIPNPNKEQDLLQLVHDVICNSKLKSDGSKEFYSDIGLIELNMSELMVFIKTYVYNLTPEICLKQSPYHLVAYIMFLVTRKFDVFKEEENMKMFLTKLISNLKRNIRKKKDLIEYLAMWMSNVFCLLNMFQQYSGVKQYSSANSADENKHNFINYDLSEFIRLLKELCVTIFQVLMKHITENLVPQSLCIDAILLHEDIKYLSKDGTIQDQDLEKETKHTSFNVLTKHLQSILDILKIHNVPSVLINQIFVHIAYLINAHCLNTLLFRTDLCYFSKGVQIRYNLSSFETWLRYQKLENSGALKCLQPMTEAIRLLQTLLKTEDDAPIVCDMCEYLNTPQIVKILHNFNPRDGLGWRLPSGLISRVETLMKSKRTNESKNNKLETPTTINIPINIPFIHDIQSLNKIFIPKSRYLPCLNILTEKDLV